MSSRISAFGWQSSDARGVARVVSAHGDYYHVVCDECEGEVVARKKKSAFLDKSKVRPITGDFVRLVYNSQGESMITEVLPRFSAFERRDPTARRKAQTLAVNFDYLFIMTSLNEDFSLRRLERYLALAEDIGDGEAMIVLTKKDVAQEGLMEKFLAWRDENAPHVRFFAISAKTGEGMKEICALLKPGKTFAFIGSSGVGKSTLVNTFAGEEWMATQEVQDWSGKGRHTTTSRELVMLPCGAMVIDTPGIREIGMVGEVDSYIPKGVVSHRLR